MMAVAKWQQVAVLDSRTGYDLLGEDKRLAIDVASMRQALEDGAARKAGRQWTLDERPGAARY